MPQSRRVRAVVTCVIATVGLGVGILIAALIWRRPTTLNIHDFPDWTFNADGVRISRLVMAEGKTGEPPTVCAVIENRTEHRMMVALHVAIFAGASGLDSDELVATACLRKGEMGFLAHGESVTCRQFLAVPRADFSRMNRVVLRVTRARLSVVDGGRRAAAPPECALLP